jgi:hypothetical protein
MTQEAFRTAKRIKNGVRYTARMNLLSVTYDILDSGRIICTYRRNRDGRFIRCNSATFPNRKTALARVAGGTLMSADLGRNILI